MFANTAEAASEKQKAVSGSNVTQSVPKNVPKAVNFTAKAAGLFFELGISPPLKMCTGLLKSRLARPDYVAIFHLIRLRFFSQER